MIHEICITLAERLKNAQWVESISLQKENFIPYIQAFPWDCSTLSHGFPGLVILFSEMDAFFPNQGWDRVAHQYIVDLVQEIEKKGVHNCTLFSGLAGICFAIHLASKQGTRYQHLLSQLNDLLAKKIQTDYLLPIEATRQANQPLSPFQYDVIAGISGGLSYVLETFHLQESMQTVAYALTKVLVGLKEPIVYQGLQLPGWYTPQRYLIREEQQALYVEGCFDTGMAHGIAGCLSALSKAYLNGIIIENQREAIQEMALWLQENQLNLEKEMLMQIWPSKFGFNSKNKNYLEVLSEFYRDGWCYGAPGIASSLFLASDALNDKSLKDYAVQVMVKACERLHEKMNLECVSLCHGLAGLLTMIHSMNLEIQLPLFSATTQRIAKLLFERYDPSLPFGYKCFASLPKSHETVLIDNAGFLDGITGTLLSLLFSCSKEHRDWVNLLLIR